MNGIIEGGWTFVLASYAASWVLLGGYAISLFIRARKG